MSSIVRADRKGLASESVQELYARDFIIRDLLEYISAKPGGDLTDCGGRVEELAALSVEQIVENAGNGGLEIVNWMMMAATVPGRKGQTIYCEAIPEWFTGMGGIAMMV